MLECLPGEHLVLERVCACLPQILGHAFHHIPEMHFWKMTPLQANQLHCTLRQYVMNSKKVRQAFLKQICLNTHLAGTGVVLCSARHRFVQLWLTFLKHSLSRQFINANARSTAPDEEVLHHHLLPLQVELKCKGFLNASNGGHSFRGHFRKNFFSNQPSLQVL